MILIKNKQRKIPVDVARLKQDAQTVLHALRYTDFDLSIILTSNRTMRTYNKTYRGKDKVTDILSFPYHPTLKAGERIQVQFPEDKNLGDIIIAPAYVQDDASAWGQSFAERMRILLVHGICHLLGYDHIKDEEYKVMKRKEQSLLRMLQKTDSP
jgi:probable rRNA maturation factor